MKFARVPISISIASRWLCACCVLIAHAMPAFAQQQPLPPASPLTAPNAGMGMPPPAWPAEFRRPRNPEDMQRWRQHEGERMPTGEHPHQHLSPDEQQALRRDLNRARREIYRDWQAWPLPPPTLSPAGRPSPRPDRPPPN